jgi:hypothetical protein
VSMTNPDANPGGPRTYGSYGFGSGADPDPQHCEKRKSSHLQVHP